MHGVGTARSGDFCKQQFRMLYKWRPCSRRRAVGAGRLTRSFIAQYPVLGSFHLQIPTSAAPKLDFVDFVASRTAVSLASVAELAKIPEFSAAVSVYRCLLGLGYCGYFCRPAVHGSFMRLTEEQLLDHLRVAAYCSELPADDARHIDLDTRSAKRRFPILFIIDDFPLGSNRSNYASSLLAQMGSFAARHEYRAVGFPGVKKVDEDRYVAYRIGIRE
jgi:hypothetical protein